MTDTTSRIAVLSAGIAEVMRNAPGSAGAQTASRILAVEPSWSEAEWLEQAEAKLAEALSATPQAFDPAKVGIHRKRMSATQGTVTITYAGRRFGPFHDDIRPTRRSVDDYECYGMFSPGDAELIETARNLIHNNR